MELTPELFEKTEFTERRKGYDIEQVETFLEQTGTALAQLLARTRHTEERAAHAEARLSQADAAIAEAQQRAQAAEQRAEAAERAAREASQGAAAAAAAAARQNEEVEVEQAAKTLLMAKRTAEATVNEARGQAQSLLEDSQNRAQRQLSEAQAEAAELVRRANEQAEAEFADRRAAVLDEVRGLEARRSQLSDVITQLESRLAGYREELGRTAQDIIALAEDPARLGARPNMSVAPDQVISHESDHGPAPSDPSTPTGADAGAAAGDPVSTAAPVDLAQEPVSTSSVESESPRGDESGGTARAASTSAAGGTATTVLADAPPVAEHDAHYVDLTSPAPASHVADDQWGPGSWSQVEAELDDEPADVVDHVDRPTEAVSRSEVPRDRFMEELDSAVNEAVPLDQDEDAAMTAFFEGTSDTRTRRFGWRR
jgi:cell division septum initiation protein DivIVA